ncbi:MAG: sensor histidine kinase [Alphaproteobacteria bacterium]
MNRFLPKSLFGQTLAILFAGFIVSQAAGYFIYADDRGQAVRAIGGLAAAQRIANATRLVQETPDASRPGIVAALSDQSFGVALSEASPIDTPAESDTAIAQAIRDFLIDELALGPSQQPLVSASPFAGPPFGGMHAMGRSPMMHGFGGFGSFRNLQVSIPLSDGQILSFATALPESGPEVSSQFIVSMAIMAMIILAVSAWAARRATAPLASLAAAARHFGRDLSAPAMPEIGTIEMRQASHAFNAMQARLRGLVENRTRMMAAISHDLRTPLTLLRLRVENTDDAQERQKMLATIDEMDQMVAATLQAARDDATAEPHRRTDLTALLASAVDDMADAGLPVVMKPAEPLVYECEPAALKRALTNLLDNAVKYGQRATAAIRSIPEGIEVTVDDEGPGIPDDELARVIQPFYRVEDSRSRETGGIGLGLAIALSVIQAHGGDLTLSNRSERGLRARITLPS